MKAWLDAWRNVHGEYAWDVELRHFAKRQRYPGYFSGVIGLQELASFQDSFPQAIDGEGSYVVAGEVCYWKNYGNHLARDKITYDLLERLAEAKNWGIFRSAVTEVCAEPNFDSFVRLQTATGQARGFATPLTFVAFYDPTSFPMVDRHIADWWAANRERFGMASLPPFLQRGDGWIEATSYGKVRHNWEAYWAWAQFCRDYARRIGGWRARDIEMAVWTAQKRGEALPTLPL